MIARVKVLWMSCGEPVRWKLTVTLEPGSPFSTSDTCCEFQVRVLVVSICTMTSPGCTPARSAGVFGKIFMTETPRPCTGSICIPSPA